MRRHQSTLATIGLIAALLALAEFLLPRSGVPVYMVPTPSVILQSIRENLGVMASALAITLGEAMTGLLLAMALSFPLAIATLFLPRVAAKFVDGFGVACQSTPLLAIAPLLTLWFGHSYLSKAVAAMIVCFFPLLTGWLSGFRSISQEQLQLFENMGATRWQAVQRLYVPLSLSYFLGGLRVSMPLALLGAIVAEFVGAAEGLGFQILQNSYYLRTPAMFAYIIISTLTGWLLTLLVGAIEQRVLFWRNGANAD